jgi:hypothetical protein
LAAPGMKAWAAGAIQTNLTHTHSQKGESALEATFATR